MSREPYDSDVTDVEWLLLEPLIPPEKHGGRHRTVDIREVVNAIFYVLRTGCAWRLLPHDFPPWQTVYGYFRDWRKTGVWKQLNTALREAVREQEEREAEPSAAIMDSQSVKTTAVAGERGYDAAQKVTGRKRHILVDVLELLLTVVVTKASVPEREGAKTLLKRALAQHFERLALIWADGGYTGQAFCDWVMEHCGWLVEIVKRSHDAEGFVVLPRRWVVERTFGWLYRFRRLSKDYELLPETSEAWIYAAKWCALCSNVLHGMLLSTWEGAQHNFHTRSQYITKTPPMHQPSGEFLTWSGDQACPESVEGYHLEPVERLCCCL